MSKKNSLGLIIIESTDMKNEIWKQFNANMQVITEHLERIERDIGVLDSGNIGLKKETGDAE